MSERSKKMKMTPSSQCPLFHLKITDEEAITIKGERIWVPGFLAFSSKFCKWEDDFSIPLELIEEARYKMKKLEADRSIQTDRPTQKLAKALLYCFQTNVPVNGPMAKLNKQAFWLNALEDNLSSALVQSLKLDAAMDIMVELLDLIYRGVMFTFSWNPLLSLSTVEALQNKLHENLHGEDFYSFNPIRLVTSFLWLKDFQATLRLFVEKFHPSRNIPLNADLAMQAMPSPDLRSVSETSVSDQTSAITQCEGGGGMLMSAVYMLHAASMFSAGLETWTSAYPNSYQVSSTVSYGNVEY
jgi:hypothetical protein